MSAQPHPYDLYQYNNGNDRDFYFQKVPYSVAHNSDIYTPKNLQSIWDHYDLAEEILDVAGKHKQQIDRLPRTFSLDHLKEINRLLGKGIFPSAGELRVVDLFINDEASYANVGKLTHSNIFNDLEEHISSIDLKIVSKHNLATLLGNTHTCLTYTHPFRFNNKATTNLFIDQIVDGTPYILDFKHISRSVLDLSAIKSSIDTHHRYRDTQKISIRPERMGELYWNLLTPKELPQQSSRQGRQKIQTRTHEQLAKRLPPPGHHRPGPPHLGR